ncbi:insulinase family protein [Candidatus Marinimicrobia bacterium MT.SAG.4]|nr:insulinase family protein [Candidatus Marinimicrobia bacterium MT.SAG.4]
MRLSKSSAWNLFAIILLSTTFYAAESKGGEKIFQYPINVGVLENGLSVISVEFDSPGLIAFYTIVRTGSRNEIEPGKSGFAHFFEHMMFRGTDKYSSTDYNDILKGVGADHNAFTNDDITAYHSLSSSDALEAIMDIESDRFQNLKYDEEDFKKEAGAVLGEYRKSITSPFLPVIEKLRDTAYETHTYKHTTIGFLRDIEDMPNQYEHSLYFFDTYYRPENCTVLVVGDVDHASLMALAEKYYGNWERGPGQPEVPKEGPQKEGKREKLGWENPTLPIMAIGYHGPAFSDTEIDMPALDLLSQVAFSQSSPLYRKLVIEEQLVDFIQGSAGDRRDATMFNIFTRVKEVANVEMVEQEIYKALEEAKNVPVDEERLASIKSHMKYQFAMGLNSPRSVAQTLAHYIGLTGDPETVNRVYELYDRVTAEDIQYVTKKYFAAENRTVVNLSYDGGE